MTHEVKKEAAMYFAGAMAWHALTHLVLSAIKTDEPHRTLGIKMTPARNAAAAVLWATVSAALTRYAWAQRGTLPSPRSALSQ